MQVCSRIPRVVGVDGPMARVVGNMASPTSRGWIAIMSWMWKVRAAVKHAVRAVKYARFVLEVVQSVRLVLQGGSLITAVWLLV